MDNPDPFAVVAVDPWAPPLDDLLDPQVDALLELEELPDYVSDSDPGEFEVGGFFQRFSSSDEEEDDEEEDEGDEEEDEGEEEEEDDQCVPPDAFWEGGDDADPGYVSLFEEEEEREDEEGEEDDQRVPPVEFWVGWDSPPVQALLPEVLVPRPRAESPSPAFRALQRMLEEVFHPEGRDQCCPVLPSAPAPALDFLPLCGSKRSRDEDEDEEDSSSKRLRLSSSEDPSTSTGSFTRYFHYPHLLQDPDSDED